MKKMLFALFVATISVSAFAYEVYESDSRHVAGVCSNDSAFAGNKDSGGYWTVSGPNGSRFSTSRSESIRKACGE